LTEEKAKDFTHKKRGWRANWKVTDEQIAEIKKSLGTQKEIAEKYGISRSRVGQIRSK
jgi:predicted XRE-type DNA-binding protein